MIRAGKPSPATVNTHTNLLLRLRARLAALNAAVSGVILVLMALGALLFTRAQFTESAQNAFAHTVDVIAYQLQSDTLVRHSYLSGNELSQSLIIHIEDGGVPFQWRGAYQSATPRGVLLERARMQAAEHGVLLDYGPLTPRNFLSVIDGDYGDAYRLSVWVLPDERGWSALIMLKDMAEERAVLGRIAWIFAACAAAGVAAQTVFSRVFSGRAIKPVERADREQKAFVQAASHELRTPLAAARACADALIKADGQEARDFAVSIGEQTRHMARLVDDMLFLAGADTYTLPMSFAPVELDALLAEAARAFAPLMRGKGITLAYEPTRLPPLWGDETRLRQLIHILLDNALEYTPEGGRVTLAASRRGREICVAVSDSGPGVADEHKPHVFDRFYRADKARGRSKAHYGLGLSIAREIAAMHGGSIAVSDRKGGGAVFTVRLKRAV